MRWFIIGVCMLVLLACTNREHITHSDLMSFETIIKKMELSSFDEQNHMCIYNAEVLYDRWNYVKALHLDEIAAYQRGLLQDRAKAVAKKHEYEMCRFYAVRMGSEESYNFEVFEKTGIMDDGLYKELIEYASDDAQKVLRMLYEIQHKKEKDYGS